MRRETVTRLRAAVVVDPYSKEPTGLDWDSGSEITLQTVAPAQPTASSEPNEEARDSVTSGYRLFFAEKADITARDRVRVRGLVCEVDGEPDLRPGFALVVTVKRVDG